MNLEATYRVWCIGKGIKIYPIRLQSAVERYKIGVQIDERPEKIGEQTYNLKSSKKGTGVYDKIKELQESFYNKNNK